MTTISDVRAAADRLAGRVRRTPTTTATSLGALAGGVALHVKCELFQRTGSFKVRGALNAALLLPEEDRARGLVSLSAGNHAAALAYAARELGTTAVVVMPATANPGKIAATEAYGGEVVLTSEGLFDTMQQVRQERGLTLVHPFDDPGVIAGAGTVGLEILDDVPDADVVVVQAGGGGLLSGVATVVKSLRPSARVVGVEPETSDVVTRSLAAGEPVTMTPVSVADGLCAPMGGVHTLPLIQRHVDTVVRVGDESIVAALRLVVERTKLAVEPSAAAGVAALLSGLVDTKEGENVVVVATGGNIDGPGLARLLAP